MLPLQNPQHQNLLTLGLIVVLVASFLFSLRNTAHTTFVGVLIWIGSWVLFGFAAFSLINGMTVTAAICAAAWGGLWVVRELTQKEVGRPEI
jgi:hypothetical protein